MTQIRRATDPYDWNSLLRLLQTSFAYMEGRVDPPPSMYQLTPETLAQQSHTREIWVAEDNGMPVACVFLTPDSDVLYLSRLAVAQSHRGQGLARALIGLAEKRAVELGLPMIEARTRVELVENHMAFATMGFSQVGETAHEGFEHPTSLTLRKSIVRQRV
ncbi:GNAT family N-acetyltransferase [Actibacterium sp. XHP0104]|uniref:GNAT family N-acetyltransferase n=1 Tax=Actibacterium sp. XHP0104 TaxID=2984335 RepID=UPI0021E7C12F|nr:GNAT family N-acetyltransferase [Actibacterium sp. XHP0104]MCV2881635.1 GNAT family N-acetyltransferase [Actibacterium sp. XHP0104]